MLSFASIGTGFFFFKYGDSNGRDGFYAIHMNRGKQRSSKRHPVRRIRRVRGNFLGCFRRPVERLYKCRTNVEWTRDTRKRSSDVETADVRVRRRGLFVVGVCTAICTVGGDTRDNAPNEHETRSVFETKVSVPSVFYENARTDGKIRQNARPAV